MSPANHCSQAYEKTRRMADDLEFQVVVRRNKLLGYWASDRMNLAPEAAVAYARAVAASDFEEPGDADVVRKVLADLTGAGCWTSEEEVRLELIRLLERAREEVSAERLVSFRRLPPTRSP